MTVPGDTYDKPIYREPTPNEPSIEDHSLYGGIAGGGMNVCSDWTPKPVEDNWKHRADHMRCQSCMYWVRKSRLAPMQVGQPWPGRCRRNAPTMKGWPVVFDTDWCGAHKLDEEKI